MKKQLFNILIEQVNTLHFKKYEESTIKLNRSQLEKSLLGATRMFFNLRLPLFQNILTPGCLNVPAPGDNDIDYIDDSF